MKFFALAIPLLFMPIVHLHSQHLEINEPIAFLALGDSYTIGESVTASERWPMQFSYKLSDNGYNVQNAKIIAKTGWRTDQLIKAITEQNPKGFNLVSLLIGVNNQYQRRSIDDMKVDFKCLLTEAISLANENKQAVFVVSIPDYAYTPFGQTRDSDVISKELDAYNSWQKSYTENQGVAYVDITGISRQGLEQPDLVAADGLHPSAKQYQLWVELIYQQLID